MPHTSTSVSSAQLPAVQSPRVSRPRLLRGASIGTALVLALTLVASSAQGTTERSGPPIGNVDDVSLVSGGLRVKGWVWDPDTAAPIPVAITAGGRTTDAVATNDRPDVARAFPEAGSRRGFDVVVRTPSGPQKVCVVAKNSGAGDDKEFACVEIDVPTAVPVGYLDGATATPDGVKIWGWAANRSTTAPASVRVTVSDIAQTLVTTTARPDVAAAFPALGSDTGFVTTVPAPAGKHEVCATILGGDAGGEKPLNCRTVTVPAAAAEPATVPADAPAVVTGTSSTGVPAGTKLTVHSGDLTVTQAGTVIDSVDVHGYLRIKAPNVTVKNSIVRGRAGLIGSMSLVQNSSAGVVIQDSELVAAYPTYYVDGFVGNNTTFTRVNIHGVVDSIKLTGDNVVVQDSWLHDNLYYASVPSGGDTHSDNVQIQQGQNITVRNNTLSGTRNAAVMVTQDQGDVGNLTISDNRADGGACTINVAEKSHGPVNGMKITNNVFGTHTRVARCAILLPPTTSRISTITGNTFTDGLRTSVSVGN